MINKIKTLSKIKVICKQLKRESKTVGLITGCFDILHYGHLSLFHFAKRRVDILIIGLDNDKSISLSKGKRKPIFSEDVRSEMLAELESVDYIFIIKEVFHFRTKNANRIQETILHKLEPSYLITYIGADPYWMEKEKRAKKLDISFLAQRKRPRFSASSEIIQKLESDL
jgi:cytidyltransferase-like protein